MLFQKAMSLFRRHRLLAGFALAAIAVIAVVAVSFHGARASVEASRTVAHTHEVIAVLRQILSGVEEAETAQRGYVITGIEEYAAESLAVRPRIAAALDRLAALIRDNPEQLVNVSLLREAIDAKLAEVDRIMLVRRREGFEAARSRSLGGNGRSSMARVRGIIRRVELREESLLAQRQERSARETKRAQWFLSAGAVATLGLLLTVFLLMRRDQRLAARLTRATESARDAAQRSAEMRAQFLANMSHEIRTPMNAIIGMTSLLLDTGLDANQRELATTVRTSADSLLSVINDVLDFSKLEAGKLAIEVHDFELRPTVESVIDLFADAASRKGVTLGVLFDHTLPQSIRSDAGRLRQVLTNLVGNALKFTESGDVIVVIDRRRDEEAIRVSVHDTGIGIDAETLPQLFTPFTQADATTTRRFGGTGLGLSISKQIVESMGGRIGAESTSGRGSTFWFELPLVAAEAKGIAQGEALEVLRDTRVLIVDDNATNRRILRHNLAAWQMETDEAVSGQEAIERLRAARDDAKPYGLVLTDQQLDGMDGVTLARLIKSEPSMAQTRVIVLSSMAQRLDGAVMTLAGIDASLTKPVKHSALFDAIVNALAGHILRETETLPAAREGRIHTNARVLIAEDNAVNQKVAVRQLARLGVQSDTVANGIEAVEAVRRGGYALVLMDMQMPEMDGLTATREIRAAERPGQHIPIIALTANALAGDRDRCLEAGMNDYLSKPIVETDLARVLRRYLPAAPPEAPPLDPAVLANLRALSGGTDEFVREIAAIYLADAPQRMAEIRDAATRVDAAGVASAAHALASASGNVGALELRQLCVRLEGEGRAGKIDPAEVDRLAAELERVERALREVTGG